MAGLPDSAGEDEPIATINIIPFVDIVLVLLIIFLLTANLIAKANIMVQLPKAASGGDAVSTTINVVLTASGDAFLNGKAVTRPELQAAVTQEFKADPKLSAVIAADKAVRYEHVIEVIDLLKQIGVTGFALNIERTAPK